MQKDKSLLRQSLEAKNRDALIALVEDLAGRYPEVERDLLLDARPALGRVAALRKQIRSVMSATQWYDSWRGIGAPPDLAHVERQLRALLAEGHADDVLELCGSVWELASGPLNQCIDEGETAMAIGECMAVAIEALPKSTLRPAEQIFWELERLLEDEYGVMESAPALSDFAGYGRDDWQEVAELLGRRLAAVPKSKGGAAELNYERFLLLDATLEALVKGGLDDQVIPLLESQADDNRCYVRLVDALIDEGRTEDAHRWCLRGYARTAGKWRDIAQDLQDRMRTMASNDGRLDVVAAYQARSFFDDRSVKSYRHLKSAAEAVSCWAAVREQVLNYLETGVRPDRTPEGGSGTWPLPALEIGPPDVGRSSQSSFPDLVTLIDIAIVERRFDDVVILHGRQSTSGRSLHGRDKEVAAAVAPTYPDVALTIWRRIVGNLIGQGNPKAYQQAVPYLKQMHKIYQLNGWDKEWNGLLAKLRREHKAKRRLVELLNALGRSDL